jgi:ABC-type sugar transport system substrate-binding protein
VNDVARLLAGQPASRRAVLVAGAGAALTTTLAACGRTTARRRFDPSYVIDATGTSPPVSDLAHLIAARARTVGMAPVLTATGALGLPADVRGQTRLGAFDPEKNRTPPLNAILAVGTVAPATLEPILATALAHGVKVVTYPTALRHRTAAIVADPAAGARTLAARALAWRAAHPKAARTMLLVLPPPDQLAVNPYAADGPRVAHAVGAVLGRRPHGPLLATITGAGPTGGALAVHSALRSLHHIDTVLVWDDDTALGAAQALRDATPASRQPSLFVGALGAPAVTSRATFGALTEHGGPLRVVVAARPRDLARALVDVPHALALGRKPRDVTLALHTLTAGSAALAAYRRDYAAHPPDTNYDSVQLNRSALEQTP